MREITVAKNAGFCFGVKRAADSIEKAISSSKGERIYTLGHLIHNPTFNKRLEDKGVRAVEFAEVEDIARSATADSPVKLFLRAHGVPLCEEEKLRELHRENEFFSYEDCACPYVKNIHNIAKDNSGDDNFFILMGSASHPEVVGIMS